MEGVWSKQREFTSGTEAGRAWKAKTEKRMSHNPLFQDMTPNDLTSSHEAPPPKGSTTPRTLLLANRPLTDPLGNGLELNDKKHSAWLWTNSLRLQVLEQHLGRGGWRGD